MTQHAPPFDELRAFPKVSYERDASITDLFRAQAKRTPHHVALIMPEVTSSSAEGIRLIGTERRLTFEQLDAASEAFACTLAERGVLPGDLVVLLLERSLDYAVAMLAVLKCGAAYVPLDPGYPAARLSSMVAVAEAQWAVLHPAFEQVTNTGATQNITVFPGSLGAGFASLTESRSVSQESRSVSQQVGRESGSAAPLAYVMFTSGSTGEPKGVAVSHRGVIRLVRGSSFARLDESRVFLQLAPVSFDASTLEFWAPWLNGGCTVLFPGGSIPDPVLLGEVIAKYKVTTLWLTASLFNTIVSNFPECLSGVEDLLTGGEALSVPHVVDAQRLLPHTQLINGYGPTESTTFTTCYRIPRGLSAQLSSIPIGLPIENTEVLILDEQGRHVPDGSPGELFIGGDGLALGYLNRPELTKERFVPHPTRPGEVVYRTGDQARWMPRPGESPSAVIEFLGRADDQVKLRGFRIELGEIQTTLAGLSEVQECAVVAREDAGPHSKRLVAYVVLKEVARDGHKSDADRDLAGARTLIEGKKRSLSASLLERLPDYMVPSEFVFLDRLPTTENGKLDKRALPAAPVETHVNDPYAAPTDGLQAEIAEVWAAVLKRSGVGVDSNFFDLGGTSILAIETVSRLRARLNKAVPLLALYQNPTIRKLDAYLSGGSPLGKRKRLPRHGSSPDRTHPGTSGSASAAQAIAIIGMAGRFPGAPNIDEFWALLDRGGEGTRVFSKDELDPSVDPDLLADSNYVPARGIVEGAELFDFEFFGMSQREAEVTDPQQRVFLEVAYHALEDAGYVPDTYAGAIGVYAGSGNPTYFNTNLCSQPAVIERAGAFLTRLGNEKDFLTTRVSYKLNLQGPSLAINTACSTSLVAVIQAAEALRAGRCDLAIAGGSSIHTPQHSGYLYQEGSMLSPDGKCRPFDSRAGGTTFNDGVACVVLKRLEEAVAHGDHIEAVILGFGINNDGSDRVSFTAPSVAGQTEAIVSALTDAKVDADSISYVEAHGTATPVGDPIELKALTDAFRLSTGRTGFCGIGSVKSNVGHLVAAAGVTGLIKTALSFKHERIPATLHFKEPNPDLELEQSPFYVVNEARPWVQSETPRRAGVSSFGVGATNAHVILEEPPLAPASSATRPFQTLCWSARTQADLLNVTERVAAALASSPDEDFADLAFTLNVGRKSFEHRATLVARSRDEAAQLLKNSEAPKAMAASDQPPVAFLFPGQGTQYVNMGKDLYGREPTFSEQLDRGIQYLLDVCRLDLRDLLLSPSESASDEALLRQTEALQQTSIAQPALFLVGHALARLWMSWGVAPAAMVGHSIGEFICATLAGVFSFEDALRLVALRGELMQALPAGAMLSVRLSAGEMAEKLGEWGLSAQVDIAAVNAPKLCVLAAPFGPMNELEARLQAAGILCKRLRTSHAFHSHMMDPMVAPFAEALRGVARRPPTIPFISTVTGTWIRPEQAVDCDYWAGHARATVRFADAISTLLNHRSYVLLEVGPQQSGITMARQQAASMGRQEPLVAVASLGDSAEEHRESQTLIGAVGRLWQAGVPVDWDGLYAFEKRRRISLPGYPFQKKRCWVDAPRHPGRTESVNREPLAPSVSETSPMNRPDLGSLFRQQTDMMKLQLAMIAETTKRNDSD